MRRDDIYLLPYSLPQYRNIYYIRYTGGARGARERWGRRRRCATPRLSLRLCGHSANTLLCVGFLQFAKNEIEFLTICARFFFLNLKPSYVATVRVGVVTGPNSQKASRQYDDFQKKTRRPTPSQLTRDADGIRGGFTRATGRVSRGEISQGQASSQGWDHLNRPRPASRAHHAACGLRRVGTPGSRPAAHRR